MQKKDGESTAGTNPTNSQTPQVNSKHEKKRADTSAGLVGWWVCGEAGRETQDVKRNEHPTERKPRERRTKKKKKSPKKKIPP